MLVQLLSALLLWPQAGPAPDSTDVYYLVFLRPDPARTPLAKADGERIQSAHMANIRDMGARGILMAAGPFDDTPPTISGIFVLKAASLDEARRIAAQDPTVVEHRNRVDVFAWRGPRDVGVEYRRSHKENPQTPEGMGVQPFVMLYRGGDWDKQPSKRTQILAAHDEYIGRMRQEGKLGASGPVQGDASLQAIVIFHRMHDDEARRLAGEDPAVKAGVLRVEYHRWWSAEHVLPW